MVALFSFASRVRAPPVLSAPKRKYQSICPTGDSFRSSRLSEYSWRRNGAQKRGKSSSPLASDNDFGFSIFARNPNARFGIIRARAYLRAHARAHSSAQCGTAASPKFRAGIARSRDTPDSRPDRFFGVLFFDFLSQRCFLGVPRVHCLRVPRVGNAPRFSAPRTSFVFMRN